MASALHPPRVRTPKSMQGVQFAVFRRRAMRNWITRHGRIFEINVAFFGRSVVASDPVLVKAVCAASTERLPNVVPNLGNWFGPGSIFGLDGDGHRTRRRLLAPAFHGHRLTACADLLEDETLRECAKWPEHREFRALEPMNRITLNVILRTILGANPAELDELAAIIPPYMKWGQLLAFAPAPPSWLRRRSPWHRLDRLRTRFDRVVGALIERAESDPALAARQDTLAVLLRADVGLAVSRSQLRDELLTLICAGHETTAAALAWTFERLRRHPEVLAELVTEVDTGGNALRRATIAETLRVRTVIDVFGRRVDSPDLDLGPWRIPHGRTVLVRIADLHENPDVYPCPERFDPHRFHGARPAAPAWMPFGGGTRRCVGADFALQEMDVVLRTVLRDFRIHTDSTADEKSRFRGIAHIPRRGGRIVVSRRR